MKIRHKKRRIYVRKVQERLISVKKVLSVEERKLLLSKAIEAIERLGNTSQSWKQMLGTSKRLK